MEQHVWGWSLAGAILVGNLVSLAIWFTTPHDVRRVIRNSDRLTGKHHGPSWKAMAVGAVIAVCAVLLIPANHPGVEEPEKCCPVVVPSVDVTIPDIVLPTFTVPSFSFPDSTPTQ